MISTILYKISIVFSMLLGWMLTEHWYVSNASLLVQIRSDLIDEQCG
jgi:hypothetical protein